MFQAILMFLSSLEKFTKSAFNMHCNSKVLQESLTFILADLHK